MVLLSSLLNVVLPAFLVMGAGMLLSRFFKPDVTSLNRIALYATVPALVFNSLSNTELSLASVSRLSLSYLAFMLVIIILSHRYCLNFLTQPHIDAVRTLSMWICGYSICSTMYSAIEFNGSFAYRQVMAFFEE